MSFDPLAAGQVRSHQNLYSQCQVCSVNLDVAVSLRWGGPAVQKWTQIPCLVSTAPRMPMFEDINPRNQALTARQTTSVFTSKAADALGLNLNDYPTALDSIVLYYGQFSFHYCLVHLDFLIGPGRPILNVPVRFLIRPVYGAGLNIQICELWPAFPKANILMMNEVLGPAVLAFDSSNLHGYYF